MDGCSYVKVLNIEVSNMGPQVTSGYKPDEVSDLSEMEGTPVDQVYIGSCTNGRIEDLRISASFLKGKKISPFTRGIVSPATPLIFRQADDEG